MRGVIFLLGEDGGGHAAELLESPYDSEDILQKLLAEHPTVLAGDQIDPDAPRKWLLVSRELGVPDDQDGSDRWAIDHLFLDQDGIPTLVEVKRSSDTRLRREVVGQLLDYAANAVLYWPVEKVQGAFADTAKHRGLQPDVVLAAFLGEGVVAEDYWQKVNTNLHAGNIRLILLADEIPTEVQRVIEFLNEQMSPAEVLAVEVRQFVGKGHKALVPRVLGQTASASVRKGKARISRESDEQTFWAALQQDCPPEEVSAAREILAWQKANMNGIEWYLTKGKQSARGFLQFGKIKYAPVTVRGNGITIRMGNLTNKPPFNKPEIRREFIARFEAIEGVDFSGYDTDAGWPRITLNQLVSPESRKRFLSVLEWSCQLVNMAAKTP